jgi:uncharacterized protein YhaN
MRFEQLILEKYGAFESRSLTLPESSGLVVVFGPNEAGKSTCLAAISDFLFGIPQNSGHGQTFGYAQMRLTAGVLGSDGRSTLFRRRKGRGQTLTDQNDQLIDEVSLSSYLGAMDRDRFSSLFGLDHASLRFGGERLLAADGDIGRLIVEAGGGLSHLISEVDELRKRSEKLFSTRRAADRAFYRALGEYDVADLKIKSQLLTRDKFEQTQNQYETAQTNLEDLRDSRRKVIEQMSKQQRLIRVAPIQSELERVEIEYDEYDDLAKLPGDFEANVIEAVRTHPVSKAALGEAVEKCAKLKDHIESLKLPSALLDAESKIRDIAENAITVAKARSDRPNREIDLEKANAKLRKLRQTIGVADGVDLKDLLPESSASGNAQALIKVGVEIPSRIESIQSLIRNNEDTLAKLEVLQNERRERKQAKPFGIDISDLSSLGLLSASLEVRRAQAEQLRGTIDTRIRKVNFETIEQLEDVDVPDASVILDEIQKRGKLEADVLVQAAAIDTSKDQQDISRAEIARLEKIGSVPTLDAIESVRRERVEYWSEIREGYVSEAEDAWSRFPLNTREGNVVKFEKAIEEGDSLADKRYSEAERVTRLEFAEQNLEKAISASAAAVASKENAEARLTKTERKWELTWPQAVEREPDLGRLKTLVDQRTEILELMRSYRQLVSDLEREEANIQPKLEMLSTAESLLGFTDFDGSPISERVQNVTREIKAHDDAYEDYRHDAKTVSSLTLQLESQRKILKENQSEYTSWKQDWRAAMKALGVTQDVSPEQGNEIATGWAQAEGAISERELTIQRLARMDEDEKELEDLISEVTAAIDFALPDDLIAAAKLLSDRLADANRIATERASLLPQLEQATREQSRKQSELDVAGAELLQLCKQAECNLEDLVGIANRCRDRVGLLERKKNLTETLSSVDDGYSREELSEQCSGRDIDQLKGGLKELEDQMSDTDRIIEAAVMTMQECKTAFDRYADLEGVNEATADREGAAAEMSRIVKQYIELTLAEEILSASIGKIRDEQQDPLILRAGELFGLATRGSFAGIGTDIDEKGLPIVVGKRASGETVTVSAMSDGTRDQMFLAFRLASVEHYCDSTEPLPFIGDDLLVHFDDERSAAALELLAELGKKTQVLLFTHHSKVVDIAKPLVKKGSASIINISENLPTNNV